MESTSRPPPVRPLAPWWARILLAGGVGVLSFRLIGPDAKGPSEMGGAAAFALLAVVTELDRPRLDPRHVALLAGGGLAVLLALASIDLAELGTLAAILVVGTVRAVLRARRLDAAYEGAKTTFVMLCAFSCGVGTLAMAAVGKLGFGGSEAVQAVGGLVGVFGFLAIEVATRLAIGREPTLPGAPPRSP